MHEYMRVLLEQLNQSDSLHVDFSLLGMSPEAQEGFREAAISAASEQWIEWPFRDPYANVLRQLKITRSGKRALEMHLADLAEPSGYEERS